MRTARRASVNPSFKDVTVNKLALALALSATALAACSTASGPTFSASELQPRDGVRTFQVDCHGLLSGPQTCMKAARKICGDEPVRAVDSARALRDKSDPATLVFQCGAAPAEAASAATPAPAAVIERVNLSGDALFATDHATLAPTARESLDRLLSERADRTYSQVTVTGFTDSVGSDDYNLALSKRRAEAVAAYLKAHGLKTDSMTVSGRGKADPVASNATPEGRASNRRVEIRLQH
nr:MULTISPECIES: OmpA family protein [Burkholderia]